MLDEQNKLKIQLSNLQKKDSPSYTNKDLSDLVYEKNLSKGFFVNNYESTMLTTVLVVVNKKKIDLFKQTYPHSLLNFYKADFENWQNRTRKQIENQHKLEMDEEEQKEDAALQEKVEAEFNVVLGK